MTSLFGTGSISRDLTVKESVIKSESFFSVYDGAQSDSYSFGPQTHIKIMENFANRREKDFIAKFGTTPDDFIEKAFLHQDIYESQKDFLENMKNANEKFVIKTSQAKLSFAEIEKLKKNADKNTQKIKNLLRDISEWERATQEYLDVMASVGDQFANSENIEIENISGQTPKGLIFGKNALTSYETASLILGEVRKKIAEIGADINSIGDTKLVTPVITNGKLTRKTKERSFDAEIASSMTGYISSAKGIVFETAIANGLYNTAKKMEREISMLGEAKGIDLMDSTGKKVISSIKTSKTDVSYSHPKTGFKVNISAKNQKKSNDSRERGTKFLATNLATFLAMTTNSERQERLLGGYILTSKKDTAVELFLATLVADMAIGSGGIDKVDFLAFNNRLMSLSDYYRKITGKVYYTTPGISKDNKKLRREFFSGEAPIPTNGFTIYAG